MADERGNLNIVGYVFFSILQHVEEIRREVVNVVCAVKFNNNKLIKYDECEIMNVNLSACVVQTEENGQRGMST